MVISSLKLCMVSFIIPERITEFAIDEGGYVENLEVLIEQIRDKNIDLRALPNSSLAYGSQATLIPSGFLGLIGIDALRSLRIVSWGYATLSLFTLYLLLRKVTIRSHADKNSFNSILPFLILTTYSIWPSYTLWSLLGLRESAVVFGVILSFFAITTLKEKTSENLKLRNYVTSCSLLFCGLSILFMSREALAYLTIFCLIFPIALGSLRRNSALFMIVATLCSFFFYLSTLREPFKDSSNKEVNSITKIGATEITSVTQNISVKSIIRSQQSRAVGANNVIWKNDCYNPEFQTLSELIATAECISKAALGAYIKPLPWSSKTSNIYLLAAWENLLWILLYCAFAFSIIFQFFRKRLNLITYSLLFYFSSYHALLAIYSGSLGSLFRHKSTLFWIMLLFIYSSLQIKIDDRIRNSMLY